MTITLEMDGLALSPILQAAQATPDWCATRTHAHALNALTSAVQYQKGYACILGESGTGKSTVLRAYADQAWRGGVRAIVVDGQCNAYSEFVRAILAALRVDANGKDPRWLRRRLQLAAQLHLSKGKQLAVLVDNAECLDDEVLSQLHLLVDSSAGQESVLQIVLAGTRALDKRLRTPLLAPVQQRITARAALMPIQPEERETFIRAIAKREAGNPDFDLPPRVLRRIVRKSRGNPSRVVELTREALALLDNQFPRALFLSNKRGPLVSGSPNR